MEDQICFEGESSCAKFEPGAIDCGRCKGIISFTLTNPHTSLECTFRITKHKKEAVSQDHIFAFLEKSQTSQPSLVISQSGILQPVFHGAHQAVSVAALRKLSVRHVVSAAGGLESFLPVFKRRADEAATAGVEFLFVPWFDATTQVCLFHLVFHLTILVAFSYSPPCLNRRAPNKTHYSSSYDVTLTLQILEEADIVRVVLFIHQCRHKSPVLVHCAQGKSRSAVCVLAYMLALQPERSLAAALIELQSKRY